MSMHMKKLTTMDGDSYDCGFDDDRDDGADNPDEDIAGTTVAITAGGARVTTHGFLGNVRVTKGCAMVPPWLQHRARLRNATTRHP